MPTTYVALDVEATGMNPEADRIIEIAAIKFTVDGVVDRWETLVRPGMAVPFAVTSLTGITQRQVDAAPPFAVVAPTLRAFLRDHPIVGQSVEMDVAMLQAAGLKLTNPVVDTFELAALLLPQLPAYGLTAVASALAIADAHADRHRASIDADLARRVFLGLWERLLEFEADTLGEVTQLTAGTGWPLHRLFVDAQRVKTRESFGASLGGIMRSAMGAGDATSTELPYLFPRRRVEPLEPTGDTAPLEVDALAGLLAPDGAFAAHFPNYQYRVEQEEMLRAVATAFRDGGQLLVEAGTGTGKSLAYLIPAVATAVKRGEAVVVSTKTIQLQDQLYHKDIPTVRLALAALAAAEGAGRGVPGDFRAALLKGRANYICLQRWLALRRGPALPKGEVRTLVKILLWLQTTETGDRAELRLLPGEEVTWARVMATPETCAPMTCQYHRRGLCFLARARREAEAAHVIVVNHALLLSDMATNSQVLPPYKHLIVDEAHRLEDEATAQLGYVVTRQAVSDALDLLSRGGPSRPEGLLPNCVTRLRVSKAPVTTQQAAERIASELQTTITAARSAGLVVFQRALAFVESQENQRGQHDARLRLTASLRRLAAWEEVEAAWERLGQELARIALGLQEVTALVERLPAGSLVEHDELLADLMTAQRQNNDLRLRLNAVIANPDPETVYWCEVQRVNQEASLHAAPLHVGATLEAGLYQDRQTLVFTSATLTTSGGFGYVKERLNLQAARETRLGSPFDYQRAALLYLADDIPEPGQPGHQRQLDRALATLFLATEGRALALFTSYSALRATYHAIKGPLEAKGLLVLGQRIDGSPRQLLERLRGSGQAVVLGTASFWEGVDVVGDALSVLVITKLPFQVPNDPVFAARSEQFTQPFNEFAVPQTILTFKQGFGRLIRSQTDRGVVAVLDRRLVTKSYGRSFLESLPPCTRRQGRAADLPRLAQAWLNGDDRQPG